MTTKKTRSTKQNKIEKYNIQIPVALDKTEQLEALAKEMDLSLAQYCRCVLLQHLKSNSGGILNNNQGVVKEQITIENKKTKEVTGEQPVVEEDIFEKSIKNQSKVKKGLGSK